MSSDELLKGGGELSKEGGELSNKGCELPKEGGELPKEGGELPKENGELPKEGGELPKEDGELSKKGGELSKEGGELSKEGSDESLASLEDSSLQDRSTDAEDTGSGAGAESAPSMELPSCVEEVEVHGEPDQPKDEWIDIIGSGDLKKKVLVAGIVESRPVRGDTVCIEITMKLSDGTVVDEQHNLTFTLGDSEVISGLDLIVPLMDSDEVCEAYIHSRFAYGSKGDEGRVPCDMSLLCTIKLLDFRPEEEPELIPFADRQQIGNRKRVRGNWWFNRGDYSEAVQCYKAAVDFLDDTEDTYGENISPEVRVLLSERLKALNNMAAAQIKLAAYDAALFSVKTVLDCEPDNVKALFRKGKILHFKGQHTEAVYSLKRALHLEPENRAIHLELSKLSERVRADAESEKSLYRRMMGIKKKDGVEPDRHPTVRMFPWRIFLTIFLSIVCVLVAYNYRDVLQTLIP